MPGPREAELAVFLQQIDQLVDAIDAEAGKIPVPAVEGPPGGRPTEVRPRDGWADLRLSDDRMEVVADVHPPVGGGQALSFAGFEALLAAQEVIHGVLEPVVRSTLADVVLENRSALGVVVARGTEPVEAYPERWELEHSLLEKPPALDPNAPRLDLRSRSPIVLVNQGDVVARRVAAQPGSQGWTVLGEALEYPVRNPGVRQPRKYVEEDGDVIRATRNGCFKYDKTSFWVDEVLYLENGVDYATGHIDFPGDIILSGKIAAGFSVRTRGHLFAEQVIDASEIVAGGDVATPFGIIGHEGSTVRAGGTVRAKYLENLVLQAEGPLEIEASVLNCQLQTQDRLVMGDRGLLVGGRVQALNGVDVFQVGTARSAKAELVCGMDFLVLEKVAWARDQSLSLVRQLKTLETFRSGHPDQAGPLNQACARIRSQVLKLGELSRNLSATIDRNDGAQIVVRGTVFEGTYVEICHVSFVVSRTLSRVRIFLDKNRGCVRAEPL